MNISPQAGRAPVRDIAIDHADATTLAASVAAGVATPERLLAEARARVAAFNPAINAVVSQFDPPADGETKARGPFHGVPFLLKDAFAWLAGTPTTNGTRLLADVPKPRNSVLVDRFIGAGLQIFGKTNCPEFNSLGTTESGCFGATLNPWNLGYSAGGSSGGSAAAVAARIVPVAHASDGAGSIRIPASNCGVVGLKPTRGRITLAPIMGESINGCMSEGVVSLTVRDSAAFLDIMEGPAPGDPYHAPRPERPYAEAVLAPPRRALRVAVSFDSLIGTPVDPECQEAVRHAATLLRQLGHGVVESDPPIDAERYNRTYRRIWPVNVARSVLRLRGPRSIDELLSLVDPFNRHMVKLASMESAVDLSHSIEWMQSVGRDFANWMEAEQVDLWLAPTLGLPPTPLGYFDARDRGAAEVMDRFITQTAFTTIANMTGQPAISLPLYMGERTLPIGVQLQAACGREDLLLQVSAQLEKAAPWMNRRPSLIDGAIKEDQ